MQNLLDVVTARFLDTPLIWLKDLASYLNVRINPIHMPDPTFKGKPDSYPTSLVSSQVKKVRPHSAPIVLFVSGQIDTAAQHFFLYERR